MDRKLLSQVVLEQHQELPRLDPGIKRDKLNKLLEAITLPHIVAVTGMRRCGKSTLILQALKEKLIDQIYYLDFEDERLIDFQVSDFNLLYEIFIELFGERQYFFFDEIQIVPQWEAYIRRMYKSGNKFLISGSSAELLSSELSSKLTGRHVNIELLPFSFKEYIALNYKDLNIAKPTLTKERGLIKQALNNYISEGGIPEHVKYKNPIILKNIYENIIYKDVITRYEIKSVKALRELALWLFSNPGALISYQKLKNTLGLGSINTVKNYIHYLENAYLIFTISKHAYSVKEQTISQKKSYVIDTGLMNTIGFSFSENSGKLLENIVYLELRRRHQEFANIYYYKSKENYEVNFCIQINKKIVYLMQVCEQLNNEETRQRETRALVSAMNESNSNESFIITLDHEETINIEDKIIRCIPVTSWLLDHCTQNDNN